MKRKGSSRARVTTYDWGTSNRQRGLVRYREAQAFVQHPWFSPIPKDFTVERFDAWAEELGIYEVPRTTARNHPLWRRHVDRRAIFKAQLNAAGGHSRMISDGLPTFAIMILKAGQTWEILPSHDAYKDARLLKPVDFATQHMRSRIAELLQSAYWEMAPAFALEMAREMYLDVVHLEKDVHTDVERIIQKYARLESRLIEAMKAGRPIQSLKPYLPEEEN